MKFHCDRCKTRYSIADERVRGKILKIRCKNCSAVVTVREGMGDPADGFARSASRASGRYRVSESAIQVQRGPVGRQSQPAIAVQRAVSPEWYLSVDGDQSGPFTIADARVWVAEQDPELELYCWRSGFSDWLAIEDVTEFREAVAPGNRSGPHPVAPLPQASARAPTTVTPPPDMDSDDFAFDAPAPAARRGGARASGGGPLSGKRPPTDTTHAPAFVPRGATGSPLARAASPGAPVRAPLADARQRPISAPAPADDHVARLSDAAFETDDADDMDFEIGEPSKVVKLPMLAAAVRNAGNAQPRPIGQAAALPGMGNDALGRGTGSAPVIAGQVAGQGSANGLAALDAAPDDAIAAPVETRRRSRLPILLAAISVFGISAGVLGFFALASGEEESGGPVARNRAPDDFEELGYRHETPGGKGDDGPGKTSIPDPGKTVARVRRSSNPPSRPAHGDRRPSPSTNLSTVGDGDLRPLTPNEIEMKMNRSQSGFLRCYERARRKDPFLDVKGVKVSISVARDGAVTSTRLSNYRNSPLGNCIRATVNRWKFRASTEGINTEFALKFGK